MQPVRKQLRTYASRDRGYYTILFFVSWVAIALYELLFVESDLLTWLSVALFGLLYFPVRFYARLHQNRFLVLVFLVLLQFAYFVAPFLAPREVLAFPFMGAYFDEELGVYILLYTGAFLMLFQIGFALSSAGGGGRVARQIENQLVTTLARIPPAFFVAFIALLLVMLNYRWDDLIPESLASIKRLVALGIPFCFVGLFLCSRSKITWALAFCAMYPIYFVIQISSGFLASWIMGNAVIIFGYLLVRRKIIWPILAASVLLTLPLMVTKNSFRVEYVQTGYSSGVTRLAAGEIFLSMTADYLAGSRVLNNEDASTEQSVMRVTMAPVVFSRVLHFHENGLAELQHGSTFLDLPLSVLPRSLFPWKPEKNIGQWFGHAYGFLSPVNYWTSVNLPPIIESYLNFGDIGPLVGLLLGWICGWLSRILGNAESSASAFVVALVFSGFANAESAISIVYGQALQTVVLVMAAVFLARAKTH